MKRSAHFLAHGASLGDNKIRLLHPFIKACCFISCCSALAFRFSILISVSLGDNRHDSTWRLTGAATEGKARTTERPDKTTPKADLYIRYSVK